MTACPVNGGETWSSEILTSKSWVILSSSCKNYALILLVYSVVICYFLFWGLLAMTLNLRNYSMPLVPFKGYLNSAIYGLACQVLLVRLWKNCAKPQLTTLLKPSNSVVPFILLGWKKQDVFVHALSVDRKTFFQLPELVKSCTKSSQLAGGENLEVFPSLDWPLSEWQIQLTSNVLLLNVIYWAIAYSV